MVPSHMAGPCPSLHLLCHVMSGSVGIYFLIMKPASFFHLCHLSTGKGLSVQMMLFKNRQEAWGLAILEHPSYVNFLPWL